jgi:antitoxin VapB
MPLNIRSEEVARLAAELASVTGTNKTDAVKLALRNELQRNRDAIPLRDRLRKLQDRVLAAPSTGDEADKTFYDALSGDP